MIYNETNDYELVSYVKERNEEANDILFKKYRPLIVSIAQKLYPKFQNIGIELNDLIQEGMIGFSYAINTFSDDKGAMFYTYAKTCVERKIITFLIKNNRQKHKFLNESLSYEDNTSDHNNEALLEDSKIDPLNLIIGHEEEEEFMNQAEQKLTKYEFQVFLLKTVGHTNKEIATLLNKDYKKIDNALQRIKGKLKDFKK